MRTSRSLSALALGVAACTQAPAPDPSAAAPPPTATAAPAGVMGNILGVNVTWGDLHARGDAAGLSALYTEDAVLMTPQGDVRGRAAIRQHFEQLFRERPDSILRTNTAAETLDVAGARAYEAGTIVYTLAPRTGGPAEDRTIRYMTFWEQDAGGRWLIRYSLRSSPSGS